ncbi:MAG: NAD(P)H-dependent oxidoreductase [Paludibacter sp.]|jgi:nitroreductase|nr:NAD(P)H-dependent oxidoreductase [Paludibacter sp.]
MSLVDTLNWRYATKRMNGTKVPTEKLENILEAIRLAPTSFGLQPFKVIVIESPELRERIFNEACPQPQIKEASHILVFAANKKINAEQVDEYMQLIAGTRGVPVDALNNFRAAFAGIVAGTADQNFIWTARQAYIAFGVGIVTAATEGVDATPMEGFNNEALNKILGLSEQNLSSVTILTLGYRDETNDQLVKATKVRKSSENLFIRK